METLLQDVRFATRSMFGRDVLLSTAAIATLAFGIGGTVAIFSLVNAILVRPLPYPEPENMIQFLVTGPWGSAPAATVPKFKIWREQNDIFQNVAAYDAFFGVPTLNLAGNGKSEQIQAIRVTIDYFSLFGARLRLGRSFTVEEENPNGPSVVVLSDELWKRRFGADPDIVGKVVRLNSRPHTVVGVMSPEFRSDPPGSVWLPFPFNPDSTEHHRFYFTVAGRLRPGVSLDAANGRLKVAADRFYREFPDQAKDEPKGGFSVKSLRDALVGDVRPALYIFSGVVGFVLLVACANVASLLLARATGRKREMAIRAAVGAGRGRLIRQLLTEGVVLSLFGGVLGLAFGAAAIRGLLTLLPVSLPRIGESAAGVSVDWRVIAFTVSVSIGVGLMVSLVPAFEASLIDMNSMLRGGIGLVGTVSRRNSARSLLVIAEVSIAVVLLVGAGLLIRTLTQMYRTDPGFLHSRRVLVVQTSLADSHIRSPGQLAQLARNGVDRIQSLPEVESAGMAWCVPLDATCAAGGKFTIAGEEQTNSAASIGWSSVSPTYFDVLGIPLLRGRSFAVQDDVGAKPVVLINETLAKQYFPHRDPLVHRLVLGTGPNRDAARQIVGIVKDTQDVDLRTRPRPTVYVPLSQVSDAAVAMRRELVPLAWIVRTKGVSQALSAKIKDVVGEASDGLPITTIRTMQEVVSHSTATEVFATILLTIFGVSALGLAAIGVYGLAAYSVQARMQEWGVRVALGASPGQLKRSIILQGLRLITVGVFLGCIGALSLTKVIAHLLYGVQPWDPGVLVSVPLVLGTVALLAIWIPACRISKVDPIVALRCG